MEWGFLVVPWKIRDMATRTVKLLEAEIHWKLQKNKKCHKTGQIDGLLVGCNEGIKLLLSGIEVQGTTIGSVDGDSSARSEVGTGQYHPVVLQTVINMEILKYHHWGSQWGHKLDMG